MISVVLATQTVLAMDYPYQTDEPQKSGWPLSDEERAYVLRPEHDRRPGREANKHLPAMWPVVPSAGNWGGTYWLDTHAKLVEHVKENAGPCDVLLVGDSITIQWGESWKKHFPDRKAINIGIGGDKTQNVLWRLDHGGVDGLQPKLILLMIGNNNMFFTPETGIEPAAKGIEMCVKNLRDKFPKTPIIVAKILPAHQPGNRFYEDIKKTNAALDPLKRESNPDMFVLDLWNDFTTEDGTIRKDLFTSDSIHLSLAGYAVYAERLKPFFDHFLGGQGLGTEGLLPKSGNASVSIGVAAKPHSVGHRLIDLPLHDYHVWPSEPPKDCPDGPATSSKSGPRSAGAREPGSS